MALATDSRAPAQGGCTRPEIAVPGAAKALVTADLWPHGLTAQGRTMRALALPRGSTVADLVAREWYGSLSDPRASGATAAVTVAVDGRPVARADWHATVLHGGEIVTLRTVLAGGGGGGDKNPLAIVFQVAVLIAAIYFPPLLELNAFWTAAATAAIVIGGTLIGNALFPPRVPDQPRPLGGGASAEPLYSLSGGANRARPYQPLLLVLGAHRVFPDLAAAGYGEVRGGEHYLLQIFHFGLGDLAIDALRIGETPLASYDEVETERGDAQGRIGLVAGNVDSIAGGTLDDTGWVERTTAAGTRRIGIDLAGRIFRVDGKGKIVSNSVGVEIEWRNDAGTVGRRTLTLIHASQAPYRRTLTYALPSADTWTVRVRRTAAPADSGRVYDEVAWAALRAYQADAGDYAGQTRLGVRIRATGQLSGRLDRLSAMVRQRVPTWDGAAWTAPAASSNPAWLFRWYARGVRIGARLVAGVGLPDGRIDEASLIAWGAWCERHALGCNHVLDRAVSHAEVLALIAQCGRASPTWQTGRLGVVWEDAGRAATALIAPGNIVAGSFAVEYASGSVADEIAMRYIEPDLDWQYNTLRRRVPGASGPPASTATLTLHGVTSRTQAAVECNLQAARQLYHRRRFAWEMAAEGLSIARGDVVHVTHSLIDGGRAGRLAGGTAARVTLNRAVDPGVARDARGNPGAGALMLFRLPDGTVHQSAVARPPGVAGETTELDLAAPLPAAPDAGGASPLDTLWRLYDAALPPVRARIVAVEPASDRRVRFSAIDEVAAYHAAATADLTAPFPALSPRTPRVLAVTFAETLVRVGAGYAVEIEAALTVAGDWRGGVVRAAVDDGPARTVARLVDGETGAHWLAPPAGTLSVTVTPGTEAVSAGAPFAAEHEIAGFLAPPLAPDNFLIDVLGDGTRRLRWTPPPDVDLAGVVIRYAPQTAGVTPAWEDMTPLHKGHLTASPLETVEPPPGGWIFAARAVDTGGRLSEEDVRIAAELGPQRLGDALIWRCPGALGWPGSITGAVRSDDGRDALEAAAGYTWDDLTTWDAWESWSAGSGDGAAAEIAYATEPVDIGVALDAALRWAAESAGDAVFEYRVAATEAALADEDWAAYAPGSTVAGRWLQLRWRVTGDGTQVLFLDHLCWSVHAPSAERKLLDRNTADWEGSAAGGRTVPVDLGLVTDVHLTLQSVGAGWSWTLVSKNDPTRIKIFDGDGNAADAVVDAVVRGIAA